MFALRCFLLVGGVLEADEVLVSAALGALEEKKEMQHMRELPPSKELLLKFGIITEEDVYELDYLRYKLQSRVAYIIDNMKHSESVTKEVSCTILSITEPWQQWMETKR